jgi:arsenite-transporting ATPase
MARWLRERAETLETIALRGTWLDREDVQRLMAQSLPGLDEVAGLLELGRLGRAGAYDLIVVDTAPTGHTLRMLGLPETLEGVALAFDYMQAKHRVMVEALRGVWPGDEADDLVQAMFNDVADLRAWLVDPARLRVTWVTLPEPMVTEETIDGLGFLQQAGLTIERVVINRVTPDGGRCRWCDAQRALEARSCRTLRVRLRAFGARIAVSSVRARDVEPVGVPALAGIARELAGDAAFPRGISVRQREPVRGVVPAGAVRSAPLASWKGLELVLFGGKGGVGKTTCAVAASLEYARCHPDRRVLLLSTDPAHSIGDAIGTPLSDAARTLPGAPPNLRFRELDAGKTIGTVRDTYLEAIDALFDRLRGKSSFDAYHDRAVMRELLNLSPPGLDELAAIIGVTEALDRGRRPASFDLVVMDTAPTGHALRLLQMPGLLQDWVKALMSILLKYQSVSGPGELGALLLRLSRGLGRLQTLLRDPSRTRVIAVTRTGTLPLSELRRLHRRLAALDIAVATVILNAVGRGTCRRCRMTWRRQSRDLEMLRRWSRRAGFHLVVAPAQVPPPRGVASLADWRTAWSDGTPRRASGRTA